MNISNKYIKEIKKLNPKLNEDMTKKDLILSYILQDLSELDNLIFKGGTCLSKCYLNYHRLSEDLDFNLILPRFMSKTKTRKNIRDYFKNEFLPTLQIISNKYNLEFDQNEFITTGTKYCPVKQGDNIFIFYIYNENNPVKIELNISEELIFRPILKYVKNIKQNSKYLTYPLRNNKIKCFDIKEIILEKIRAILTRPRGIHERDIFDLYLINKKTNIFLVKKELIQRKIQNSFIYNSSLIKERLIELKTYKLFYEIENISIIKFEKEEYIEFYKKLIISLKKLKFL
jgi:predicted nucleotidyltransferase component of viral defense system